MADEEPHDIGRLHAASVIEYKPEKYGTPSLAALVIQGEKGSTRVFIPEGMAEPFRDTAREVIRVYDEDAPMPSDGGELIGDGGQTEEAVTSWDLDKQAAFFIWDALEFQVASAVRADEMEVAAQQAEALYLTASQDMEWWDVYHELSDQPQTKGEHLERGTITAAMERLRRWAIENDHPVQKWFE